MKSRSNKFVKLALLITMLGSLIVSSVPVFADTIEPAGGNPFKLSGNFIEHPIASKIEAKMTFTSDYPAYSNFEGMMAVDIYEAKSDGKRTLVGWVKHPLDQRVANQSWTFNSREQGFVLDKNKIYYILGTAYAEQKDGIRRENHMNMVWYPRGGESLLRPLSRDFSAFQLVNNDWVRIHTWNQPRFDDGDPIHVEYQRMRVRVYSGTGADAKFLGENFYDSTNRSPIGGHIGDFRANSSYMLVVETWESKVPGQFVYDTYRMTWKPPILPIKLPTQR